MAPEIMQGLGYTFTADIYALGICLYEFIAGYLPYGEDVEDPYDIYSEIINATGVPFPPHIQNKDTKKIITQLLHVNPKARFNGNFGRIKAQPFFDNFDWVLFPFEIVFMLNRMD